MIKFLLSYLINPRLKEEAERVFEGIGKGRKRELENWFEDKWVQLEFVKDSVHTYFESKGTLNYDKLIDLLTEKREQFREFSEIFIVNSEGTVNVSTAKTQIGKNFKDEVYFKKAIQGEKYMYGPYIDPDTLTVGNCHSNFFDEVTLMFALPIFNETTQRSAVICGRIPNDVMSDVIQEEDTHVYKESGDNYLFMVKNNRNIPVGTAISRSRFEDNTFTLGDNLKDGIKTKKWGTVKIKKHTEFEIVFNDPATESLHEGVEKTIRNGSNLEAWPGYPEYRHILVGGKGILIHPPHSDEVWGMMCEGDIEEIYKFRSLNIKLPFIMGIISILMMVIQLFGLDTQLTLKNTLLHSLPWLFNIIFVALMTRTLIVKPLKKVTHVLQEVAEGGGDLTLRVPKSSNDEIGEISRWFNKFLSSQMTTIKRAGIVSKTSEDSAKLLSDMTADIQSEAPTVSSSVKQIIDNLNKQNDVFENTKDKFIKLTRESEVIDSSIVMIDEKINNTNKNAIKSIESSQEVLNTMETLKEEMTRATDSIRTLQDYSQKINEVVITIDRIAKQTQLLSLNATIESARAGEAGKGFAVVAEQISSLALECAEATISIGHLIGDVQSETERTATNIQNIAGRVEVGSDSVKETIDTFGHIQKEIRDVSETAGKISSLVRSQSEDFLKINSDMDTITSELKADNASVRGSSDNVLYVVDHIFMETNEIKELSKMLFVTSTNLNKIVDGFNINN